MLCEGKGASGRKIAYGGVEGFPLTTPTRDRYTSTHTHTYNREFPREREKAMQR